MKKLLLLSVAAMLSAASLNAQTTNYPDPIADAMPSVKIGSALTMEASGSTTIAELADKTVRRAIVKGDNMYVLALDASNAPYIYVINLNTNAITSVSTEGTSFVTSGGLALSDIALTADNYLIGCNFEWTAFADETTPHFKIYKWENNESGIPTGSLSELYSDNTPARFSYGWIGESLVWNGTLSNGTTLATAARTPSATDLNESGHIRWFGLTYVDGVAQKGELGYGFMSYNKYNPCSYSQSVYGVDYKLVASPINTANFVFDGSIAQPIEFILDGNNSTDCTINGTLSSGLVDASVTNTSYFKATGSAFMVAPVVTEGACTGIQMINVTEGLDNAGVVASVNVTSDATALDNIHTCGRSLVDGDEGKVELYLLRGNSLSKFTSQSGVLTGIEDIMEDANAPVEYYNLQGVKVANPENGLFIKKQGNKATKVIL